MDNRLRAFAPIVPFFRLGLNEAGYVEGQNVAIEYRWAEGRLDRLPPLAADLVRRQVAVIAATGGNNSALVAMQATSTIPIVFSSSDNAVERGLVASINRPGGNVTGVSGSAPNSDPSGWGCCTSWSPMRQSLALLINPNNPELARQPAELQNAARAIGLQLILLTASTAGDIDTAFTAMVQNGVGALLVGSDPFFWNRREQIIALAAQHAIPTIYADAGREMAEAGGLMTYGNSLADAYRRAGIHTAADSQGREAVRAAGRSGDQVRADHQPQDSKGAWPNDTAVNARPRRRGDRVACTTCATIQHRRNGQSLRRRSPAIISAPGRPSSSNG